LCIKSAEELLMADSQFTHMLKGFSLTTAEIFYHLPDHPSLLQTFIWQEYDLAPKFPKLIKFLDFWSRNIDGKLAQVRVASQSLIAPAEVKFVGAEFRLM
jgi:uncharacterized protein Usg